jgi:hypothetical protein
MSIANRNWRRRLASVSTNYSWTQLEASETSWRLLFCRRRPLPVADGHYKIANWNRKWRRSRLSRFGNAFLRLFPTRCASVIVQLLWLVNQYVVGHLTYRLVKIGNDREASVITCYPTESYFVLHVCFGHMCNIVPWSILQTVRWCLINLIGTHIHDFPTAVCT